jgi:hypothetical protein
MDEISELDFWVSIFGLSLYLLVRLHISTHQVECVPVAKQVFKT